MEDNVTNRDPSDDEINSTRINVASRKTKEDYENMQEAVKSPTRQEEKEEYENQSEKERR